MKARHKFKGGGMPAPMGAKVIQEVREARGKDMGMVMGDKPKMRADKRARGGRVSGSDQDPFAPSSSKHPFSSAHKG